MPNEFQDKVRNLVFHGTLNVEVRLHKDLVVKGTPEHDAMCHISLPRESYLVFYLPFILQRLKSIIKVEIKDDFSGWWFEMEDVPIFWNHPVGSIYDSLTGLNPDERVKEYSETTLTLWDLTLNYGETLPSGVLPIVDGFAQLEDFWRHQWKQACFIMNGSSKQMMSLSIPDSKGFWNSVLKLDKKAFYNIASRIIPRRTKMRHIPIRAHHTSTKEIKVIQPNVSIEEEPNATLASFLETEFSEIFTNGALSVVPVIQGIKVPLEASLVDLYTLFFSIDGFLHISICNISRF
ncbi:HBR139Wp [Eremothecium sinecaudum]|uniref:Autophagy protein 5 n=1 Tax=Eremothecium sinecaudum TaxID=45286 RepID=A0A109UWZ4_9SACH|nr:HBR139Wp [Eremothecium sinecaudum]AMD19040.1 HBR139Wp [Eremothecium sinecaudum]